MRFVKDGPDIPLDLVLAHEEGRVVLFCGAGVSMPAGLPSFEQLLQQCKETLGAPQTPSAPNDAAEHFDRTFALLEQRYSAETVRAAVQKALNVSAPPHIAVHAAILALATRRDGRLHLVTTNFDRLFEAAKPGIQVSVAPELPVPKPAKWNSLVYLHGNIAGHDPHGSRLVLTSGDLGVAYLVDGWASRFITDLFRRFTVLFIGYSAEDTVMRYLLDALAAERQIDHGIGQAYALAGHEPGAQASIEQQWKAKNVSPILYDSSGQHAVLASTLQAWARIHSGGATSRLALVNAIGPKDPSSLPEQEIQQLCWAVSDKSGDFARAFARLDPPPPFAWAEVLAKAGLLGGATSQDDAHLEEPPIVGAPWACAMPRRLGATAFHLARWLARHGANPDLLRWIIKRGGGIHPDLAQHITREPQHEWPDYARHFWQLVLGSRVPDPLFHTLPRSLERRVAKERWLPALRGAVLDALQPCVVVKSSWRSVLADSKPASQAIRLSDIIAVDCELRAGNALPDLLMPLRSRTDFQLVLRNLSIEITVMLRTALDLLATADTFDASHVEHPSIAQHAQNRMMHGWTYLVELARDSAAALAAHDHRSASALVDLWATIDHTLFRRLTLHAACTLGLPDAERMLSMIRDQPREYFWMPETQVELFPLLNVLCAKLDDDQRDQLVALTLAGPSRDYFRADADEVQLQGVIDRMVWQRLVRLQRAHTPLGHPAMKRLAEIEAEHPKWRYDGTQKEDFPHWVEVGWGRQEADIPVDVMLRMDSAERLRVLTEVSTLREGRLHVWQQAVASMPTAGASFLEYVVEQGSVDPHVWRSSLFSLTAVEDDCMRQRVLGIITCMPDDVLDACAFHVADILREFARSSSLNVQRQLLDLLPAAMNASTHEQPATGSDDLSLALNSSAGRLADAIVRVLRSRALKVDNTIPADVARHLELAVSLQGQAGRLSRVMLCSHFTYLFDVDPEWTLARMVPLLDWATPEEARGAWHGFLSVAVVRPALWDSIKGHFVSCFSHIDKFQNLDSLASVLAAAVCDLPGSLTTGEIRLCLGQLGDQGRGFVASWLSRRLEAAESGATDLWRLHLGPLIETSWPKEVEHRGADASIALALCALHAGSGTTDAVRVIRGLIVPTSRVWLVIDTISERPTSANDGGWMIELLDGLVPVDLHDGNAQLRQLLQRMAAHDPSVDDDPRYKRLVEIAARV